MLADFIKLVKMVFNIISGVALVQLDLELLSDDDFEEGNFLRGKAVKHGLLLGVGEPDREAADQFLVMSGDDDTLTVVEKQGVGVEGSRLAKRVQRLCALLRLHGPLLRLEDVPVNF